MELQVARTIRVWPAGLPGRAWDGEGSSEWLTTESPCIGIVHDHVIEAYLVRFNEGIETVVEAGAVGFSSYLRLPPLPVGRHHLSVRARRSSYLRDQTKSPDAEGYLILNVRQPEAWRPGRAFHTGLVVSIDPLDAGLDAFWENRVRVSICGPESHQVHCSVSLTKGDGTEILNEQVGDTLSLPVTPETWSKNLARFVSREDYVSRYLEATAGCLTIKGDELGEFRVPFERTLPPVRWTLRKSADGITIRLIDDAGQEGQQPRSYFRSLERPLSATEISADQAHAGIEVTSPGGLFVGQLDSYLDAVVVSVGLSRTGLQGLGVSPKFPELEDGSIGLAEACRHLALWSEARLAGFLPDVRREQLIEGLANAIYKQLCGVNWVRAESAFCATVGSSASVDGLQRNVHKHPGFAAVLRRDYGCMKGDFDHASAWYVDLSRRHGICGDRQVCDAALRLASDPHSFTTLAETGLDNLIEELRQSPAVLRGARMLALLSANEGNPRPARLWPRWRQ